MAIDTFAKRMVVAGIPHASVGVNVFPGTTGTVLGRAASAWTYSNFQPTPPAGGGGEDHLLLGIKVTFGADMELGRG